MDRVEDKLVEIFPELARVPRETRSMVLRNPYARKGALSPLALQLWGSKKFPQLEGILSTLSKCREVNGGQYSLLSTMISFIIKYNAMPSAPLPIIPKISYLPSLPTPSTIPTFRYSYDDYVQLALGYSTEHCIIDPYSQTILVKVKVDAVEGKMSQKIAEVGLAYQKVKHLMEEGIGHGILNQSLLSSIEGITLLYTSIVEDSKASSGVYQLLADILTYLPFFKSIVKVLQEVVGVQGIELYNILVDKLATTSGKTYTFLQEVVQGLVDVMMRMVCHWVMNGEMLMPKGQHYGDFFIRPVRRDEREKYEVVPSPLPSFLPLSIATDLFHLGITNRFLRVACHHHPAPKDHPSLYLDYEEIKQLYLKEIPGTAFHPRLFLTFLLHRYQPAFQAQFNEVLQHGLRYEEVLVWVQQIYLMTSLDYQGHLSPLLIEHVHEEARDQLYLPLIKQCYEQAIQLGFPIQVQHQVLHGLTFIPMDNHEDRFNYGSYSLSITLSPGLSSLLGFHRKVETQWNLLHQFQHMLYTCYHYLTRDYLESYYVQKWSKPLTVATTYRMQLIRLIQGITLRVVQDIVPRSYQAHMESTPWKHVQDFRDHYVSYVQAIVDQIGLDDDHIVTHYHRLFELISDCGIRMSGCWKEGSKLTTREMKGWKTKISNQMILLEQQVTEQMKDLFILPSQT